MGYNYTVAQRSVNKSGDGYGMQVRSKNWRVRRNAQAIAVTAAVNGESGTEVPDVNELTGFKVTFGAAVHTNSGGMNQKNITDLVAAIDQSGSAYRLYVPPRDYEVILGVGAGTGGTTTEEGVTTVRSEESLNLPFDIELADMDEGGTAYDAVTWGQWGLKASWDGFSVLKISGRYAFYDNSYWYAGLSYGIYLKGFEFTLTNPAP